LTLKTLETCSSQVVQHKRLERMTCFLCKFLEHVSGVLWCCVTLLLSDLHSAHAAIATRATQMVERLSEENRSLRQELKDYYKKVSKLEKVKAAK